MTTRETSDSDPDLHSARWELLEQVNRLTDRPMIALSFVWLGLLIVDFTAGLSPLLQTVSNIIWALFVLDFLVEFIIAPSKVAYLRRNWLGAISLALPALRGLRILPAIRLVRAARAARGLRLFRLITSLNRGMRALGKTLSRRGAGYIIALTAVVTAVGAAGMAVFESPASLAAEFGAASEPGAGLASYGEALWWTAMIMTTMGSEYWPRTPEGRILGWLLSLYAFAVFGYIVAAGAGPLLGLVELSGEHPGARPDQQDDNQLGAQLASLQRVAAPEGERRGDDGHQGGGDGGVQQTCAQVEGGGGAGDDQQRQHIERAARRGAEGEEHDNHRQVEHRHDRRRPQRGRRAVQELQGDVVCDEEHHKRPGGQPDPANKGLSEGKQDQAGEHHPANAPQQAAKEADNVRIGCLLLGRERLWPTLP